MAVRLSRSTGWGRGPALRGDVYLSRARLESRTSQKIWRRRDPATEELRRASGEAEVADAVAAKRRRRGRKAEAAPAEVVPAADIDGNGYEIPANLIPDPLGADLGLGLYPRARARGFSQFPPHSPLPAAAPTSCVLSRLAAPGGAPSPSTAPLRSRVGTSPRPGGLAPCCTLLGLPAAAPSLLLGAWTEARERAQASAGRQAASRQPRDALPPRAKGNARRRPGPRFPPSPRGRAQAMRAGGRQPRPRQHLRPQSSLPQACPRVHGYPRTAGMGLDFYPSRIAGAGAGTCFSLRVRVSEISIRTDFTRCHQERRRRPTKAEAEETAGAGVEAAAGAGAEATMKTEAEVEVAREMEVRGFVRRDGSQPPARGIDVPGGEGRPPWPQFQGAPPHIYIYIKRIRFR
ncbi:hypothetical protein PVAP13_1KG362805 [Panicum virgatum]|uniref:Uncharacterized protein n=1 Tax=Panicum virgatum TaxID=38727 RepID=A0A8T0XIL3_PANVG|nr:hypothetical protein PVAP13_1KG362805 [Panicum virgatum]